MPQKGKSNSLKSKLTYTKGYFTKSGTNSSKSLHRHLCKRYSIPCGKTSDHCICKTSAVFGKLIKEMWLQHTFLTDMTSSPPVESKGTIAFHSTECLSKDEFLAQERNNSSSGITSMWCFQIQTAFTYISTLNLALQ